MTKNVTSSFSLIGGHAALDLLNTRPMGGVGLIEKLDSFERAVDWAVQCRLLSLAKGSELRKHDGKAALKDIKEMREHLRKALISRAKNESRWRGLIKFLNELQRKEFTVSQIRMSSTGTFLSEYLINGQTPDTLTFVVSREILSFLISGDWMRARQCEGKDCVLWFVDKTRNHSRHWCDMGVCGSREKARTYYYRMKSR